MLKEANDFAVRVKKVDKDLKGLGKAAGQYHYNAALLAGLQQGIKALHMPESPTGLPWPCQYRIPVCVGCRLGNRNQ